MSRSIDPRRPRKPTPEQYASVNKLLYILKLQKRVDDLSDARLGSPRDDRLQKAIKRLRNEKQWKRRLLLKDIVERYKIEQPVEDSERQLSGLVVDEDTRDALVRADMSPEQLGLIAAIFTLPGKSPEQELQRRITAINAVTLYCGVEEGAPSRHVRRGPPGTVISPPVQAAEPDVTSPGDIFYQDRQEAQSMFLLYWKSAPDNAREGRRIFNPGFPESTLCEEARKQIARWAVY